MAPIMSVGSTLPMTSSSSRAASPSLPRMLDILKGVKVTGEPVLSADVPVVGGGDEDAALGPDGRPDGGPDATRNRWKAAAAASPNGAAARASGAAIPSKHHAITSPHSNLPCGVFIAWKSNRLARRCAGREVAFPLPSQKWAEPGVRRELPRAPIGWSLFKASGCAPFPNTSPITTVGRG